MTAGMAAYRDPKSAKVSPAIRRWLVLAGSLVLTAVTLYFVFRGIDSRLLRRLVARQNPGFLVGAGCLLLLQITLGAERWRTILGALSRNKPSLPSVQAVYYASIFFNSLPIGTVGGDVVRIWLARQFAISTKRVVLSVLIDRVLVVLALMVLAAVTLPFIKQPFALDARFAIAALLFCTATGFLLLRPIERILGRWRDLGLVALALRTMEELRAIARKGAPLGLFYALSSSGCYTLGAYCIGRSLGLAVGPVAMIAVMSIVIFVTALPISLAGWGVREVSVVALLGFLGVDHAAALLLSIEFGLLSTLLSLPGGAIWLGLREGAPARLPPQSSGA